MIARYTRRISLAAIAAAVPTFALLAFGEKEAKGPFADADPDVAALAEAAVAGDCDLIDKLVARKVNVNAQGAGGISPLVYCLRTGRRPGLDSRAGNIKGFERLLVHGADPNLRDDKGCAAIHYAAGLPEKGPKFLKIALSHGGDPNLRESKPAGRNGEPDGAPTAHANDTPTPIFRAISARNPESLRILLRAGADLKARDGSGKTPLMWAAVTVEFEDALVLLEAGADFRVKDDLGLPFSHFFTDEEINFDPTTRTAAMKRLCREYLEQKGVDFAKEKIENEKIYKQIREQAQRETDEFMKRQKEKEKSSAE